MFCIQCEQTIKGPMGSGCIYAQGLCGKTAQVSDLQDVLVRSLQGVSFWASLGSELGIIDPTINRFSVQAFFATLTNVNFDTLRIIGYIKASEMYKIQLEAKVCAAYQAQNKALPELSWAAKLPIPTSENELNAFGTSILLNHDVKEVGDDIIGLRLLCLYGLKGAAAYLEHAAVLGEIDSDTFVAYHQFMSYLGTEPSDMNELLSASMKIGELGYKILGLLNKGETQKMGHPEVTQVNVNPVKGKCILVSGHDMVDLKLVLEQTQDKGINVYTHGEMLPAHSYPELKKYSHLIGNYGGAWQNQQKEFADFPGAILMTTNCLIDPTVGQYANRIFTRSMVGWPGVVHIEGDNFSVLIDKTLSLSGFTESLPEKKITIGFGEHTLMQTAPAVVEQVKSGAIKHFFLVGGCDGARGERNYFTDFAMSAPQDSVILTLGCGKYRFNKQEFGDINGIPRLIDIGQCNDAYSAIQLALALADVFECSVNELPLTLVVSWFEQKAALILLTLLSLGVKGIYLGPTLPAFLTPQLVAVLVEQFDLRPTGDAATDLQQILQRN